MTTIYTAKVSVSVDTEKGQPPAIEDVKIAASNAVNITLATEESEHQIGLHSEIVGIAIDWDTLK